MNTQHFIMFTRICGKLANHHQYDARLTTYILSGNIVPTMRVPESATKLESTFANKRVLQTAKTNVHICACIVGSGITSEVLECEYEVLEKNMLQSRQISLCIGGSRLTLSNAGTLPCVWTRTVSSENREPDFRDCYEEKTNAPHFTQQFSCK